VSYGTFFVFGVSACFWWVWCGVWDGRYAIDADLDLIDTLTYIEASHTLSNNYNIDPPRYIASSSKARGVAATASAARRWQQQRRRQWRRQGHADGSSRQRRIDRLQQAGPRASGTHLRYGR